MEFVVALGALVFGVIAWRKAEQALTEIRALQALLAARQVTAPLAPTPVPAPGPAPTPIDAERFAVPPALPPPLPPAAATPAPAPSRGIDIERLLTQRWGVWLGALAILIAGVFLVRTAAERGLLGPGPRCAMGLALGLALIAAATWLRRRPAEPAPDDAPSRPAIADYGPAALAAGGLAVLFAAAYGAGPLYGIVPPQLGFLLLAAAALAGLALSLLFGPLVAALGLLAAFATPALVATDGGTLPGLFAYLLFVSAACWAVVRYTAWTWLGWGAALGGALWVLLVALGPGEEALWPPGLFVPAATALTLALLPRAALDHPLGRRFAWAPLLLLGLAGLVLASTYADPMVRTGLLLLAPIAIAKAWTEPRLAALPMLSAGLSIATLLVWRLPAFQPTAETIGIEGVVQAVLPGDWAPGAILPFLQVAALVALAHAAAGLAGERRQPRPLPWAALVAAVPLLCLATAYAQVGRTPLPTAPGVPDQVLWSHGAWALAAGVLAAALVAAAGLARREGSLQRAGIHAAGAVGAIALGCAIMLDAAWLTVALAAMLPALAWIARAAGLPELRRVALVVAGVVLVRLVLNPWLPGYPVGDTPVLNLLLVAYGIPAAAFALAARLFGRGPDRLHPVLQAGACLFSGLLVVLEVRHWRHGTDLWTADPTEGDIAWITTLLGAFAVALQARAARAPDPVLAVAWRLAGGLALLGGAALLLLNPFISKMDPGQGVLLNDLLPAYLFPGGLALLALARGARPRRILGAYALLALLMWASALVRHAFHPDNTALWSADVDDAELWALSGAWSVLAAATLAAGIALRQRALRLAGLALVVLVIAKVFLVDMSGLDGLWRVLSFLGLGLFLIGLGAVYRRFGARL